MKLLVDKQFEDKSYVHITITLEDLLNNPLILKWIKKVDGEKASFITLMEYFVAEKDAHPDDFKKFIITDIHVPKRRGRQSSTDML